jgi:hypothetical protein
MREFLMASQSWLFIAAIGLAGAAFGWVIGFIADRLLRPICASNGWRAVASSGVTLVVMGATLFAATRYLEPHLREECCRARATAWVTKSPAYATLAERHPDAKEALVKAMTKIGMGDSDAIIGHAEFSAVLNHYLRVYLPVTSDSAAREFAMAAMALVDEALKSDPELCVNYMNGRSQNLTQKLPAHVMTRYGNAVGRVITEGINNPQAAPDPGAIRWQRQQVAERMKREGNPLATDPKRLLSDPNRACFALLAAMSAVGNTVPEPELGAFLRGTVPDFIKDDGA